MGYQDGVPKKKKNHIKVIPQSSEPQVSPVEKEYFQEMHEEVIKMIEDIDSVSNTVKGLLKNAFVKIITAERGLNWVLCMRRELGEQGCDKMKNVLNYLSLLAADRALEPSYKLKQGLSEFLTERNLIQQENPLVRLARLIRRRRHFSQEQEDPTQTVQQEDSN